jgi:2-polyprenyl-3-methyl-5-hydroxy-6-metoxy-1,4-benzoquinol methylase
VDGDDKRDVVRRGCAALSCHDRGDDADDGRCARWRADLHQRLPTSAAVLDLGGGCGVPVARVLACAGHRVTGVDISGVPIERARGLVPTGSFRRADATQIDLPAASFGAVVCLDALIPMPVADQPGLIDRIASWLRPGGRLLTAVGKRRLVRDRGQRAWWPRRRVVKPRRRRQLPVLAAAGGANDHLRRVRPGRHQRTRSVLGSGGRGIPVVPPGRDVQPVAHLVEAQPKVQPTTNGGSG